MLGLRLLLVCSLVGGISRLSAADEDPDTEMARRHFDTGAAAYEAGRYAEAAAEFERARKLQPLPAFDFNLGRVYDRMERPADAIAAYQRYLQRHPTPPDAGEVHARIAVLRAREVTAAPPPDSPREHSAPRSRAWIWGTVAGVIAVGVGLGVGLGIGLSSRDANIPKTTDGNVAIRYP